MSEREPKPIDKIIRERNERDRWSDEHNNYDREQEKLRSFRTSRYRRPSPAPVKPGPSKE